MSHPPLDTPDYRSTRLRAPRFSPVPVAAEEPEIPALRAEAQDDLAAAGAIGERIVVEGRVLDTGGRPVRDSLVEIWQANAAGRYAHEADAHPAPLDPNFTGAGRCVTDAEGRYRFTTIRPGAYPWANHDNAWRPAHIHFSLCGRAFVQRLVTQMYFPGDPLLELDPIFNAVRDPADREALVAAFDLGATVPDWALAYRFDIVLRATPFE